MARRSKTDDPKKLISELLEALPGYVDGFDERNFRERVQALIGPHHLMRDVGSSLMASAPQSGGKRILAYFRQFVGEVIAGDELMVVSGISEYARRIRELRVEQGWPISSGVTFKEQIAQDDSTPTLKLKPDDYVLLRDEQDLEAAKKWRTAKNIRGEKGTTVSERLIKFFKANVGKVVTNEELRYVANDKTEWARRARELRTDLGWAVATQNTGRPDLKVGEYILEHEHQAEPHDRLIPDEVRAEVLSRDNFRCVVCGWTNDQAVKGDPRTRLELHHVHMHAKGGTNDAANLITLCNVHHDVEHRKKKA